MVMASLREYATVQNASDYGLTVTDEQISLAEEIIDAYVGVQCRFIDGERRGEVTAWGDSKIYDTGSGTQLFVIDDYYKGAILEIIGGTGLGETRVINGSNRDENSITYEGDSLTVDTSTVFRIFQRGKFPRRQDAHLNRAGDKYYKIIPEAINRAVLAQLEYMDAMGDGFFKSDQADKNSEQIGNYGYSKGGAGQASAGVSSLVRMIAPKARALLRGIRNTGGKLLAENPTWL